MHNAAAMRFFQSIADFDPVFQNLRDRHRPFSKPIGQGLALQTLHHQVVHTVLMADVVERANIGMVQRRDGSRFALETLPGFGVFGKMLGKNLDCNGAVESRVPGAIHFAHSARPKRRLNLVRPKFRARVKPHASAQL